MSKAPRENAMEAWLQSIALGKVGGLATVLQSDLDMVEGNQEPLRMFIGQSENVGELGNAEMEDQIIEIAYAKFQEKVPKSETKTFELKNGMVWHVFLDIYVPPIEIMIFGAGHDAIPVAAYSVSLGMRTTVVDVREHYNNEERFPGTKRIIARHTDFADTIQITDRTYVIVMNHHIEKDEQTLAFVLKTASPYIGVLGPRSRRIRMLERLDEADVHFTKEELGKIHSPIGLDIGARSPQEIAISMLAEIIAIKNGHPAGFLTGSEVIHH